MKSKSLEAEMTRQETLKIAGELVPGADRKWRSEITDELLKVYARGPRGERRYGKSLQAERRSDGESPGEADAARTRKAARLSCLSLALPGSMKCAAL